MFNLAVGFVARMRKPAVDSEGEATSSSEGKPSKQFPLDDGGSEGLGNSFS